MQFKASGNPMPLRQRLLTKTLLVMNLTVILSLVVCLQVSANAYSQKTITLSQKNVPLETVFKEIKKQTGYTFFCKYEWLQQARKVDIDVRNASLDQVLELCFKDQPLTYAIVNTTIMVRLREGRDVNVAEPSQLIDIKGKVTNDKGEPLSGASVEIKNSKRGTFTDANGMFELKQVDANAMLLVSFTGYAVREITVKRNTFIPVSLALNTSSLDETVVIAYGTTTQRLSTGNVSTVKAADIAKQPVNNLLLALQGRVPGLLITQPSGLAGSSIKVRIQGQNSIMNGNDPLYVIDGVPVVSQLPMTGIDAVLGSPGPNYNGNGNPLNYINPSDIESVDILKDADATAIYGSRAANGAILITTKKGKTGPMHFDLNMQKGWGQVPRKLNMLNTRQYLDMRYEAFRNDGITLTSPFASANDLKVWDTTRYTDWQKKLIGGTANYANISTSISGGTSTMQYLVGGTYHKETTVFPFPSDFADEKGTVHFNLNSSSANQKFRMQFSGSYMYDKNQLPQTDLTQAALLLEPDAPVLYNPDGSINWGPNATGTSTFSSNPMINVYTKYRNSTSNLISNFIAGYKILPGLDISTSVGYNNMQTNDFRPNPLIAIRPELRSTSQRYADYGDRNLSSWIIEPQAKYTKNISGGKLDLLIGTTILDIKTNTGYLRGAGHLSDEMLEDIHTAATITTFYTFRSDYKYDAAFARLNYNWQDKYIIDLNARRDGSSRFGDANRFHNFGSVGGAWLFYNEGFIRKNFHFLSFGKLKGSYGTTGSDQIGDYNFMSLYNLYGGATVPYQGINSLIPAGLPNPHLQWEETRKLLLGIDLGLLQNRVLLSATYVQNRSSNQLLSYSLPSVTGFSGQLLNFPATIENKDWEFSVNTINIHSRDFNWTSSVNVTIPKNKLIAFPNLSTSAYSNQLVIGQPISVIKAVHLLGVDTATGSYKYESKTDPLNPTYPDDYTKLVNIDPKYYGGFQNSIGYMGFEFDFLFQFVKQLGYNDALFWNGNRYPGNFFRGFSNQPVAVLDRWQKPGDNASIKQFSTSPDYYVIGSDYRYSDASYIRLKNVAISWEFPAKWISKSHFRNCRITAQGQNLLTITKYKGLDPENQSMTSLPPLRVWTMGIQVGL